MDIGIYALAARLRDELAAQLDATRAGAPCFAVVHPGNMAPAYGCECGTGEGMAWVRVVDIGTSVNYPQQHGAPIGRNDAVVATLVLELGTYRCYPNTEDNSIPPLAYLDSAARDAIDDAAAMRRAARCAFTKAEQPIVGNWRPHGPQGGVHGGVMTVTVLADVNCPCDVEPPQLDEVVAPLEGDPRF
ncbi:hypothetical protein CH276_18800 [Rhodococcus sp. 06-470-2]|uniref:hypothetical protein n=1 Tax=unclassified Rhodococcus (in: high G+C Gram-positive bacteria) TaxID=192944 RepID=UPI000B9C52CC|nr:MULTISPECIES: hypothetical protein [unclassified Rhodococcus (in: high G+C Gram-positive bacteria)]OZC60027.1 hypothetical protein CH276_18800 [Rhodococcus sp. 06-470-2]OZE56961.1 hypothetical protein CH265_24545 [Rhodococcus sp. 05-2221-1B]